MIPLQIAAIVLVGVAGTAVVLARDPLRQAFVNGVLGLALVILFVIFQAPDVALSMAVVSGVGVPFIVLVALAKIKGPRE